MKAQTVLPGGYQEVCRIDLQKNKRQALLVNGAALLIAAAMIIPMCFYVPVATLFDFSAGIIPYSLRFLCLIVGILFYIVLHELVHAAVMRLCGTRKVNFGFTGLYAFAGSTDYYDRTHYITIALAPIVVWGIVLAILNAVIPVAWFWVVYFIQVTNISGAAGDLYVSLRMAKLPRDLLVQDSGVSMIVYAPQTNG